MRYSQKYRIGPGDSVEIFVWRYPEVSTRVTVRPDGYISARLLEDIPAAGKTPTELARELERELSVYLRDPLVSVVMGGGAIGGDVGGGVSNAGGQQGGNSGRYRGGGGGGFVGIYPDQIRVVGEAASPQALLYKDGMTLLDLMIEVGGITEYAAGNKTVLMRIEEGEQRHYTLRVEDLIRDGDLSANVDMRPGDILIIPESWL